jgi:hypothetical protein
MVIQPVAGHPVKVVAGDRFFNRKRLAPRPGIRMQDIGVEHTTIFRDRDAAFIVPKARRTRCPRG